jgi:hypothetical protein
MLRAPKRKDRSADVSRLEIHLFCHETQWGGKLDTFKLGKQVVLLKQPGGGFEYESIMSQQFNLASLHKKITSLGENDIGDTDEEDDEDDIPPLVTFP